VELDSHVRPSYTKLAGMTLATRVAAVLLWVTAVGFGVPCLMAIKNLLAGQPIPLVMGFPAYGGGPFERHGIQSTVPLVTGFLLVCVLEGAAGWALWGGHKWGAVIALATLPMGAAYWWGFALPFPPLFAIAWTVLIAVGWKTLD
jgi:hypothetical protein